MSEIEYLYGLDGDEHLQLDPDDVLDGLWDQADPPLAEGLVVAVSEWKARSAEEFMPDVDRLLDWYGDVVYDAAGEDAVEAINWSHPDLRGAAANLVAAMNRRILWKVAGPKVALMWFQLIDAEEGRWQKVGVAVGEAIPVRQAAMSAEHADIVTSR